MDLDEISVAIRPRNHWESIDLGFRLAREHARALYLPWLLVLTVTACLIHLLCGEHTGWALFLVWWLLPLLGRVPLHVLSRAVFGSVPQPRDTLRAFPAALRRGPLYALTLGRLDPARAFNLALWQLEGLRGSAWRQRMRTMEKRTRGAATWHALTCLTLELVMIVLLFGLLMFMTPEETGLDWAQWGFGFDEGSPLWLQWLRNAIIIGGPAIVEPLYVAGGFSLYLNRRTVLEGWDIEIAFRRMARRLSERSASEVA